MAGTLGTMTHKSPIHSLIALNTEGGVPASVQLLPAGSVVGRDGRAWLNSHPGVVLSAFNTHGGPLAIDYEHASEKDTGAPAPASGWITALEDRGGEIWGTVEWTERAANMIAAKEYRFLSPVFYFDEAMNVVAMKGAGLTNQPNLIMTALNKRGSFSSPDIPTPLENQHMDKATRIALCKSLGLADEASDAAILTAVTTLKDDRQVAMNKAETPDPKKFVPIADYDLVKTNLATATNSLHESAKLEAEAIVDQAIKNGKIAPSSKDYHLAACKVEGGLENFQKMVEAAPKLTAADGKTQTQPGSEDVALNNDQTKILEGLGISLTDEDVLKDLKKVA